MPAATALTINGMNSAAAPSNSPASGALESVIAAAFFLVAGLRTH